MVRSSKVLLTMACARAVFIEGSCLESKVIAFVTRELGVSEGRVRLSTRIGRDLGVDGDDGLEFIVRFGEMFSVNLAAFKPPDYFGPEGFSPLRLLSPRWWRERGKHKDITVQDLLDAARAGAWLATG